MDNNTVKHQSDLQPGWYAIGFVGDEGSSIDWNGAPIYQYLGEGAWMDDDGEPVEGFFDPVLQMTVTTDSADAYLRQQ